MNKKILYIGGGMAVAFIALLIIWFVVSRKTQSTDTNANIITVWGLEEKKNFDQIITDFQDENPGIKVNYVQKNANEYLSDAINAIAAGKGPDVWAIPHDWLPQYHDKLIPLPEQKIASGNKNGFEIYQEWFPPIVANNAIINNQIYGTPLNTDVLTLFYNPEIFSDIISEASESPSDLTRAMEKIMNDGPKNWDELVRIVKFMTKRSSNTIERSAIALGTDNNISRATDIMTLLMLQNGAKMTADDLTAAQFHIATNVFGGADYPGRRALEFYTSFADPKSENYTWNKDMPNSIQAFAGGKTAMMIDYKNAKKTIKNLNPDAAIETFDLPQIKGTTNPVNFTSYTVYTVTKAAKNPNLSWALILSLTTDSDNLSNYKTASGNPVAFKSNEDDENPINTAKFWFKPEPVKTEEIFKTMIQQANSGVNLQTAAESAAAQITTLLQKLKAGSE